MPTNLLLLLIGCPSPKTSTNVQDQIDALTARLDAEIADRDAQIAALQAQLAATGDDALVTHGELAGYATTADVSDVVRVIRTDTTWTINEAGTGDYATIGDAITALDGYHIASDAIVTIQVEGGDYDFTEPLTFHHPDGGRVRLIGDLADPGSVNLWFAGSSGIVVDEGSALGYLGGFSLHGDGLTNPSNGVAVEESSAAIIGPLDVDSFGAGGGDGLMVRGASYVIGDELYSGTSGWLTVTNIGGNGIYVLEGSAVVLPRFDVSGAWNHGVDVESSSFLDGSSSSSQFNANIGYHVGNGAFAYLPSAETQGNAAEGFRAFDMSGIYAPNASAGDDLGGAFAADGFSYIQAGSSTGSGDYGYESSYGGFVDAPSSDVTSATRAAYVQSFNGTINAYAAAGMTSKEESNNDADSYLIGL